MQLRTVSGQALSPFCYSCDHDSLLSKLKRPELAPQFAGEFSGSLLRHGQRRSLIRKRNRFITAAKREGTSKEERQSKARSAKALPIRVVSVAKAGAGPGQLLAKEYAEKIRRYCTFEELVIRPNPKHTPDADVQVASEGERVLKSITPRDYVVVLDERGRDLTSEQLADLVADAGDTGCSALLFCIGGPYGHSPAVRSRANVVVRLSCMVLNHEVALIVLLEQIYRAWTILKGEKYHH
ncbi:DUF163 containing protein [Klebsormidium nitens]|uniref:DUF163 containing protein n=1 Tax=Klebsormidium nitens TaxID=105231 RepID=A0A0U9HN55_KLENI|nr:DUF163 containing protein [Klebsormidium nitens]|eukprot:GAQ81826.1 DUF163 containing protein [Klebsormidium nitens]